MVELALILPMILMLTLGVIDVGRGISTYITLTNGAREGARWLSITPSDIAGARQRVLREAANARLTAGDLQININSGNSGQIANIEIIHNFPLFFGMLRDTAIRFDIDVSMPIL